MSDVDLSDTFDDPAEQISRLQQRIEAVQEEMKTAPPDRRAELGWWTYGAHKHMWRLAVVARARQQGEHRFIIHEMDGDTTWGLCSCGARLPGSLHEDYTLESFSSLDGHVRP